MPLRAQTRIACQRCRKKRAKCDGQSPCARCDEAGESCEYDHIRRESKGELRAETVRLRKDTAESDTLLRAVASIVDPYMCRVVLQGLMDGSISRQAVLQEFYHESDSGASTGPSPSSGQSGFRPHFSRSASTSSFGQLLSWKSCRPNIHNIDPASGKDIEKLKLRGTILSLPPLPLDAYTSHAQTDTWTRTGWTKAHLRHLIDALRTWDYLPFCLFSEELFLRDYDSGATQYCSSALVHAILALSTRLINESSDDTGLLPSGWKRSRVFLDEAKGMLQTVRRLEGLPDIQALGMLSLYHLRCGRENEAHEVAKAFATSIRDLLVNSPNGGGDKDYVRVRNITYCGAVTLTRMLSLASGRIFNIAEDTIQEDLFSIDQLPGGGLGGAPNTRGGLGPIPGCLATDANARPWNVQLIAASLFQLTEWVYQLISSAQTDAQAASDELPAVYKRCLDWYTDFFSLLPPDGGRTPFVLFIHMYYHFCLLCAFRPFVSFVLDNSDLRPHEICIQATQSILALGQSYDELFTLRRVSGLIPYFICASGLFSLGMEEGGSEVDPVHLRPGDDASFMTGVEMDGEGGTDSPSIYRSPQTGSSPSHVMMSAAAHARLLLAKMAATHPAAVAADKLMRQEIAQTSPSASEEMSTLGSSSMEV